MAERDHSALAKALEDKGLNACPACGNPNWIFGKDPVFLPFVDPDQEFPGWRTVVLFCSNCGLVHLHNYAALIAALEIAEDSGGDDEQGNDGK